MLSPAHGAEHAEPCVGGARCAVSLYPSWSPPFAQRRAMGEDHFPFGHRLGQGALARCLTSRTHPQDNVFDQKSKFSRRHGDTETRR